MTCRMILSIMGVVCLRFLFVTTPLGAQIPEGAPPQLWQEIQKLVALDAADADQFGRSVSISGDTLVVGADGDDDVGAAAGSAYIFERDGDVDNWGEVTKITASDGAAGDLFGGSVSISGDTALVAARLDDDAGDFSGSAYIFERSLGGADNWGEVTKLIASDAAAFDQFGISVSISGDTAVVGAHGDDDVGSGSGSVYIFERDQGGADNWGEVTKITASDGATADQFGFSVSISGDTVVVGAQGDNDAGNFTGSAYIFERNQGGTDNWGEVTKLTASDAAADAAFGSRVAVDAVSTISGDTVVVGAAGDDHAGDFSGSAYIFERNQGGTDNWGEVRKLTASDAATFDQFASSVSISDNTVVVGAGLTDDVGSDSGSAYIFERNLGGVDNWGEATKITASDAASADELGRSVSISGDTVVVGADENDDACPVDPDCDSGSAYIFKNSHIFTDGFETGDTSAWSGTAP